MGWSESELAEPRDPGRASPAMLTFLRSLGIAPGSLFIIIGTGLSTSAAPVLQSSAAPGLPTSLNQTSLSVTVGGVTTTPPLYYTSATQFAAVLPSTTPAETGTLTITYNGQSAAVNHGQPSKAAMSLPNGAATRSTETSNRGASSQPHAGRQNAPE